MALIMLCGQPCSGKTTITRSLMSALEECGIAGVLVDDGAVPLPIAQAFADSAAEKVTRAALKAEVDRKLSRAAVVVLDSLNAIKGFRYEMWCLARAAATRSCVLHVDTPADLCRQWNRGRAEEAAYPPGVLDDLLGRFERPDGRQRWDAPLFEVRPSDGDAAHLASVLQRLVASVAGNAASCTAAANVLSPTVATAAPAATATNLLSEIDSAAQYVIGCITDAQQANGGAAGRIDFGADGSIVLNLSGTATLPELRKHKRGFIKLATQNAISIRDSEQATQLFVAYLLSQLA